MKPMVPSDEEMRITLQARVTARVLGVDLIENERQALETYRASLIENTTEREA